MARAVAKRTRRPDFDYRLGEISQQMKILLDGQERAQRQRDTMQRDVEDLKISVTRFEAVAATVTDLKPHVEDYKRMKQRGIGIWLVVTLLGSVGGGWLLNKIGVKLA